MLDLAGLSRENIRLPQAQIGMMYLSHHPAVLLRVNEIRQPSPNVTPNFFVVTILLYHRRVTRSAGQ